MSGKLISDAIAKTRQIKFLVQHLQLPKMNYYYFTNARLFMGILITMLLFAAYNLLIMNCEAKEEVRLRLVGMH
jgi:hypothetical protein